MKLIIDTNAYTAFKRGLPEVLSLLESAEIIYLPAVVIGELYTGFYSGNQLARNARELELFLSRPGVSCLDITKQIADRYGILIKELKLQGTPIPTNDVWIAAGALENGLKLLTRDKHFEVVPGLVSVTF